jgi:predicted ATPase
VFVQILCAGLDLHPPLTGSDVVARVRALDRSLERFLPLYLHLLSVQSDVHVLPKHLRGEHLQAALLDALAAAVGALTRLRPLLVVIEDWHWSDTGSRAAFARVADLATTLPLTLIVTGRADQGGADCWPASTTFVRLERLDFAASTSIVETALGGRKVSGALARRLYERAGGNPLFLEQMCAALLEQRAVTRRDGVAVVEDEENLPLPETVQRVIRARLDILDARALEVVRVAAVIGRDFDHALLAEVVPAGLDLRSAIAAAEAAGLVRRASIGPTLAYRFTHALTQEVCYESLVAHQRKMLHGAIARARLRLAIRSASSSGSAAATRRR